MFDNGQVIIQMTPRDIEILKRILRLMKRLEKLDDDKFSVFIGILDLAESFVTLNAFNRP